jgi:hypothetical protein
MIIIGIAAMVMAVVAGVVGVRHRADDHHDQQQQSAQTGRSTDGLAEHDGRKLMVIGRAAPSLAGVVVFSCESMA